MSGAPQAFQTVADGILVFDAFGSGGSGLVAGSGDPFDRFSIYNSPFDNFFVFNVNGSADTPPSTTGSGDPFDRFTIYNSQFDNYFVFNVNGTVGSPTPTPTPTPTGQVGGSFEVPHWDWLDRVYQTAEDQAIEVLERARKRLEARGYYDS